MTDPVSSFLFLLTFQLKWIPDQVRDDERGRISDQLYRALPQSSYRYRINVMPDSIRYEDDEGEWILDQHSALQQVLAWYILLPSLLGHFTGNIRYSATLVHLNPMFPHEKI